MKEKQTGGEGAVPFPGAFFLGDFNVGKSALINALLRREALWAAREESHALPTFVGGSAQNEARYAALARADSELIPQSHEEFLNSRSVAEEDAPPAYAALAARLPGTTFRNLVLVDTPGASSDSLESVRVPELSNGEAVLLVVVTDIEYWSAKHTMDLIAYHHKHFGGALIVAANKADHLNANEIRRICDRAGRRMARYGIATPPPFLALSARLEAARGLPQSECRARVKREVRDLCDAGFDRLRVLLYEFEGAHTPHTDPGFEALLKTPLAASFIASQQGAEA